MHISKGMFQNIIKIAKYQTFSKLAVLHPPFTSKPSIVCHFTSQISLCRQTCSMYDSRVYVYGWLFLDVYIVSKCIIYVLVYVCCYISSYFYVYVCFIRKILFICWYQVRCAWTYLSSFNAQFSLPLWHNILIAFHKY